DPVKLCETVRAVAICADRFVRRAASMRPDQEEIDPLLEEIDRLSRMISDSGLHQTQLAAWVRNVRRKVESGSECPGAMPTTTPCAAGRETRSTEARIREYFGPDETPALGAAISEAVMCLDPRYLGAIMEELGPGVRR